MTVERVDITYGSYAIPRAKALLLYVMPELQAQSTIAPSHKDSTLEECTQVYFIASAYHIWQ